jgi:hypothetical protein
MELLPPPVRIAASKEKWTDEEEDFLKKMERQCDVFYNHHTQDYKYYHRLASKFNIPILIVSAINALTAVALNEFVEQKYVSIINAVLSAGTGVLGSIQLYMKINERMTNALRSSIAFKRLGLKISKEITLARVDRATEGQAFLGECFAELNTAIEQGNPVERLKLPNYMALRAKEESQPSSPSVKSVAESLLAMARMSVKRSPTPEAEVEV